MSSDVEYTIAAGVCYKGIVIAINKQNIIAELGSASGFPYLQVLAFFFSEMKQQVATMTKLL